MKRFLLLALTVFAVFSGVYAEENDCMVTAGPDGKNVKTVYRKVSNFTKIAVNGYVTVYYTQGSKRSVKIKGPSEKLKDLDLTVSNNTLSVTFKGSTSIRYSFNISDIFGSLSGQDSGGDGIYVYVTSPDLVGVKVFGSGDFICQGRLDTDNMYIELKGSGDIKFKDIICDGISTNLIGSGDISIKKLDALNSKVALTGSGDIDISQKNTKHTDVLLKGSGDISISFANCGRLESSLKGSGDITFSGTVGSMNKKSLGSGDYHIRNLRVAK